MPQTTALRPASQVEQGTLTPITLADLVQALCSGLSPRTGAIDHMLDRIERNQ